MPEVAVGGTLRVRRNELPDELVWELEGALSREVPVRGPSGRVVGTRPVSILSVGPGPDPILELPRGALDLLRGAAARRGLALSFRPRVVGAAEVGASRPAGIGITLRPYQRAAVDELHRRVQCLVKLPCGGGKTTIGAAAVVELGIPALVVVPTRDILDQWIATLDRTGADRVWPAGGVRGRKPPRPGEVVVGTPASVTPEVLQGVGVVVVDECHRALARTWHALLAGCPARFRWGLTATPERSDRQEWALPYLFGSVVEPATTEELIAAGWLASPRVLGVRTGWKASGDCRPLLVRCGACGTAASLTLSELAAHPRCRGSFPNEIGKRRVPCRAPLGTEDVEVADPIRWSRAVAELASSAERNGLLLRLATAAARIRTSLALVSTVAQAEELAATAASSGVSAAALSGSDGKRRRREVVGGLRDGTIRLVFATKVADEGLDVPSLGCVILADPGRAQGRALQRAGRSMRPKDAEPLVLDLVDDDGEFVAQWLSRKRAYQREYGRDAGAPLEAEEALRRLGAPGRTLRRRARCP